MYPQAIFLPGTHPKRLRFSTSCYLISLLLGACSLTVQAEPALTDTAQIELGRRIYVEGILPSGEHLKGNRLDSEQIEGAPAACETCHRRSGMGSVEGGIIATPITGKFLFHTKDDHPLALLDISAARNITKISDPYTEESFVKALREGVKVNGQKLNPLMPKYDLNDNEIKAVIAYLKQLSAELSPGVGADTLHFATILTPGVDEKKADVMVKMMRMAFTQRNATQESGSGRMRMPLDLLPRTLRRWELSVWELKGDPASWPDQLKEFNRKEPVFAVISGLSNSTWKPVHEFCQQEKLPCLLPSLTLPPQEKDYYSLYYSRGVALEADVLAKYIREQDKKAPKRLIQVYQDNEAGRGAAQALSEALKGSTIKVENRLLHNNQTADLKVALKGLTKTDGLMLWLSPTELAALTKAQPKPISAATYVSGFLAEDNYVDMPKEWKSHVMVIYPYELGNKRDKNLLTVRKWLEAWQIPLIDEIFQSEVFFNVLFLTDLSSQMLDNLYRDYLVERAEDMLSTGSNVSAYPHLSLARNQRFASKGAYIAKLNPDGKLTPDSEWITP